MSNKFKGMKKGVMIILASLMVFIGILFATDIQGMLVDNKKENGKNKMKKDKKAKEKDGAESTSYVDGANSASPEIKIIERWDLPKELKEVSGIAYLSDEKFACIQDESGSVYIYNCTDDKIEKEISFSGVGDYEGIAVVDQAIYVIRADGKLFMIENMNAPNPEVKEFTTGLTIQHNIESLCYDKVGNRLLMTGKDKDPDGADQKKIYSFDIESKKWNSSPVYAIDLNHNLFSAGKKSLQPSAMGVHPVTSEIYIVDGPAAKLFVFDSMGLVKNGYTLDQNQFPQAEGISFGENGDFYISTEGNKTPGAIFKVILADSN
jgi:uncharacterized protein YjiK